MNHREEPGLEEQRSVGSLHIRLTEAVGAVKTFADDDLVDEELDVAGQGLREDGIDLSLPVGFALNVTVLESR